VFVIPFVVRMLNRGDPPWHWLALASVNEPDVNVCPATPVIVAPADAFKRALQAARDMGWEVVAADAAAGRIEATDTTFWFGFKDDVVIRVEADGTGSRVDVRSVSRVGVGDVGANAKRIRAYLRALGT